MSNKIFYDEDSRSFLEEITLTNGTFSMCEKCKKLIKIDKIFFGSFHFCLKGVGFLKKKAEKTPFQIQMTEWEAGKLYMVLLKYKQLDKDNNDFYYIPFVDSLINRLDNYTAGDVFPYYNPIIGGVIK